MSGARARDDLAREAYGAMRSFVLDDERRRQVSDALGISFGKLRALLRLVGEPLAMGDLAARLQVDRPNLATLVNDLELLGLVERRAHPRDGRVRLVGVTASGEVLARRAQEILGRPPEEFASLTTEDLGALVRILRAATSHALAT